MGTRPTLFSNRGNFSKIAVKIKQQQHASSCEMPSNRCPDVPQSNVWCQVALCKYLDAYGNAMTRVSVVQSKRVRDLFDAAERKAGVSAAFGWNRRGAKCGDLLKLDPGLRVLPAQKPIPRTRWPTTVTKVPPRHGGAVTHLGCHITYPCGGQVSVRRFWR
jgi:hypothetical protein